MGDQFEATVIILAVDDGGLHQHGCSECGNTWLDSAYVWEKKAEFSEKLGKY